MIKDDFEIKEVVAPTLEIPLTSRVIILSSIMRQIEFWVISMYILIYWLDLQSFQIELIFELN